VSRVTSRPGFSAQTLSVLAALCDQPSQWQHGYALAKQTGLKSGTLYPILIRLADRGLVEACWQAAARVPRGRAAVAGSVMNTLNWAAAAVGRSAVWLLPAGRRDWVAAVWAEAHKVPSAGLAGRRGPGDRAGSADAAPHRPGGAVRDRLLYPHARPGHPANVAAGRVAQRR
jgi:hypothetical protein